MPSDVRSATPEEPTTADGSGSAPGVCLVDGRRDEREAREPRATAPYRPAPTRISACLINATGTLFGPATGSLPLAPDAIEAAAAACRSQARPARTAEAWLETLTGASDCVLMADQESALVLVLAALAGPKGDVVVARSELFQTAGGIRTENLIRASGVRFRETGASNAVTAQDFRAVVGPATRVLLQLHNPSPAAGSEGPPPLAELAKIGRLHGAALVHAFANGGLAANDFEPTIRDRLEQGADVVIFPGDRLIGGPACGIVLGNQDAMAPVMRLAAATRSPLDRMVHAALGATLSLHGRAEPSALQAVPFWRLIAQDTLLLEERAHRLGGLLAGLDTRIVATEVEPGPGLRSPRRIESRAVAVTAAGCNAASLAARLAASDPAIACRVTGERPLFDVFAVRDDELGPLADGIRNALDHADR